MAQSRHIPDHDLPLSTRSLAHSRLFALLLLFDLFTTGLLHWRPASAALLRLRASTPYLKYGK